MRPSLMGTGMMGKRMARRARRLPDACRVAVRVRRGRFGS
jgi:hypothetical protein